MKRIVLVLSIFYVLSANSQELRRQMLAAAGSSQQIESVSGNFFIQQSVGQHSVIGAFTAENNELRQGYIQPLPIVVIGSDPNSLEVLVYPNPFINGVLVTLEQGLEAEITTSLFDMNGRLVKSAKYEANAQLAIPLAGLSQGAYFLCLSSEGRRVVKQLLKR